MKARKIYGLLGGIAALAMCATAFAQDGPPPRDDQSGPPQERMGGGPGGPGGMRGPGGQGFGGPGMGGPRMGMRRMGGPGLEPLVLRPDVAKELKLSDSQVKKLKALFPRPDRMNGMRGGPGGMGMRQGGSPDSQGGPEGQPGFGGGEPGFRGDQRGGEGRGEMRGEPGQGGRPGNDGEMRVRMNGGPGDGMGMRRSGPDQMDDKIADILNDSQMKRLKQLRLQREGAMVLMRRDIADKVGLSEDDRYRLRGMIDEQMESMRGGFQQGQERRLDGPQEGQRMGGPGAPRMGGGPGLGPDVEALHAKMSEKILKSLSSSQRAKWNELVGKPFKFAEGFRQEQGMRRGPGGPGGPDFERGGRGGDDDDRGGPPPPSDDDQPGSLEQGLLDAAMFGEC